MAGFFGNNDFSIKRASSVVNIPSMACEAERYHEEDIKCHSKSG